jgi:hypothetical protein
MLQLLDNGKPMRVVPVGGWIELPNGDRMSPAEAGWTNGRYSLVAYEPPPPPPPTDEEVASGVRYKRNRALSESDWTQLADAPVDREAWTTYRQALRDIPLQPGFPHEVVYPTKPDGS